jgi:hypothetical protein
MLLLERYLSWAILRYYEKDMKHVCEVGSKSDSQSQKHAVTQSSRHAISQTISQLAI